VENNCCDYCHVADRRARARAFGAFGERVTTPEQFIPALRRAEESGKAAIVEVAISRELPPPVTRYEAAGLRKV